MRARLTTDRELRHLRDIARDRERGGWSLGGDVHAFLDADDGPATLGDFLAADEAAGA
jgi:hypothetical protein